MSRIGRLPITVPAGVDVKIDGSDALAKLNALKAVREHLPELLPLYQEICEAAGGGDLEARFPGLQEHFTYVIASDGDMEEGVTSEASSIAGTQQLGNLIVFC